jgi:Icc-related predicted phosphoesterase
MKLRILSDLHLEFGPFDTPQVEADVVILAGDTHPGKHGVQWAKKTFPDVPVLYLMGNHEFYGKDIPKLTEELKVETNGTNIHVLENSVFELEDVVFLGTTLWSDFQLCGSAAEGAYEAEQAMSDFRKIRTLPHFRKLRARDLIRIHAESVLWLRSMFKHYRGRKIVTITHHAPSARSLEPHTAQEDISSAYASHLDELVDSSGAVLWVHGHIHTPADYTIGRTRVLSNPRGYPDTPDHGFQPCLVVEV